MSSVAAAQTPVPSHLERTSRRFVFVARLLPVLLALVEPGEVVLVVPPRVQIPARVRGQHEAVPAAVDVIDGGPDLCLAVVCTMHLV